MRRVYMEMIYIDSDGDARVTNVGAAMANARETRKAFKDLKARYGEGDFSSAAFLCDLHTANGDIEDTIAIRREDFTAITGEPVLSDAEYRKIDNDYNAALAA